MLIKWREYSRARKGTIRYQAIYRGYSVRKDFAAVKTQQYYRRYIARKRFVLLKCAVVSLQCQTRSMIAKSILFELKKEQKDVGKLKQNNEKLKEEMASLRAMLAAQAKEGAALDKHTKELKEKEDKIFELEKRIAEIEKELEAAKALVEKLEASVEQQKQESAKDKAALKKAHSQRPSVIHTRSNNSVDAPDSPTSRRRRNISADSALGAPVLIPSDLVSSEALAEHRAKVAILEEELDAERKFRREADGEIIKLRAKINGVELNDADVQDLLAQKLDVPGGTLSEASSYDQEPSRLRYIFFALVALMLEVFCGVFLLRRRAFLRVSLQMLAGMGNDCVSMYDDKNQTLGDNFAFEYEEFDHRHSMDIFHASSWEGLG